MFFQKVDSSEQSSPTELRNFLSELRYAPSHRRAPLLRLSAVRTVALGLAVLVSGACASTAVTHASARKPASKGSPAGLVTQKGANKAKKPTETTISYRVATTLGEGITPPAAKPTAAAVTPAPAPSQPIDKPGNKPGDKPIVLSNGDCRVMPLGDSLTAFAESYRGPLYRTFKSEGLKVDFVGSGSWEPVGGGDPDGEGHGGFRIGPDESVDYQGKPANLDAYITDWLKAAKPNVILLTIGTNDLAAGGTVANAAAGKLQNLVAKIRQLAPEAHLVVGDIPPNTNAATLNPQVNAVDEVARKVGNSGDPKITYGDTAKNLLAAGFTTAAHTNDGTHFTVEGGVLFAKAWYPTARAAIRAACGM
jgi:GDSL-like Lipase/Acylhydrolase family